MRGAREVRESLSGCGTDPRRTLIGGIVNEKVEIVGFSKAVGEYDLLLEVENRYPCAVESDPRLCSLGRELVENGRRHKLRKKSIHNQVQLRGDEKLYCEKDGEKGSGVVAVVRCVFESGSVEEKQPEGGQTTGPGAPDHVFRRVSHAPLPSPARNLISKS